MLKIGLDMIYLYILYWSVFMRVTQNSLIEPDWFIYFEQ